MDSDSDDDATVCGVVYDLAGTGGKSASTVAGKNTAIKRFDEFLQTKGMSSSEKLSQKQVCKVTLFQEFGTYLCKFAYNSKKDDVLLGWLSCKQFLSGVKNVVCKKFPKHAMWSNLDWYKKIRLDIDKIVCNRCIALGVPMVNKSEPIGRELMLVLIRSLLGSANTHTEQKVSVEYWAALVMTFAACGRGGECAQTRWGVCTWNSVYQCLETLWNELKTSRQKVMLFFCDFKHYLLCFYFSFACYLLLGAGSSHVGALNADTGLLFPFLQGDTKGKEATSKLSNCIKKQQSASGGALPADASAKCLRVGAVQEIVNRTKDISCGIARGGWGDYLASVTAMMEYHTSTHHTLATGGKALAGWPEPEARIFPPTCDAFLHTFSGEDTEKFNRFLERLFFSAHSINVARNVHLRPLALCCFASLLQHLKDFVKDHGTDHLVVKTLYSVTKTCGFRVSDLVGWGEAVQRRWQQENARALAGEANLALEIVELRATQAHHTDLIVEQNRLITEQSKQMAEQNALLRSLLLVQTQVMAGQKRPREDETDTIAQHNADTGIIAQHGVNTDARPDLHTVLPPPISVPPRSMNAFDLLMKTPPTPMEHIPCTMSLYDFLILWYERGYQFKEYDLRWSAKSRQDKNKIGAVLGEVCNLPLSADMQAVIKAKDFSKLPEVCTEIVKLVSKKYGDAGMKFNNPPTIFSVDNKITELKNAAKRM